MAWQLFMYTYRIVDDKIYSLETGMWGVETYSDDTLTLGESFTKIGYGATMSASFLYASGDGFVFTMNMETYLFTDTLQTIGSVSANTGGSFTVCFLAGTHIATPGGECLVEDLAIGDLVLTMSGETRPVRWIGRQTVTRRFADPLRSYPIRVAAGALGESVPLRDLFLSPDHALMIDGVLAQAGALVNGTAITRVDTPEERFTYFHIELEDHALVLAEGAPAETFVDNVSRRRFDNYAEFAALYGDRDKACPEMDLPRVKSARQLPEAIRMRLATRSKAIRAEVAAA
ncbi:Hint domain-containing protein [Ancylobacter sp. Lp-2]|uniref:Hint domain-containing protein n=1 Tax=Ancylobacter sp. Lp-2 TaxID=2881339 RepID=UPI001E5C65F4|nr:Hint domain-containing protein [Ancylobacter sp. Lp-2]MCB4768436.1 Hint domain-containing protein [Ancylobacter sp. Lp-2]